MLEEIKFKTRKGNEDYIWFSHDKVDEAWKRGYLDLFFKTDNNVNLFAEIDGDSYRVFFDKINSFKRLDNQGPDGKGRIIYNTLLAQGKRGSDSAKAMFKLLANIFLADQTIKVSKLFDEHFTAEYIESIYDNARTEDVESQVHIHLSEIIGELPDVEFNHESIIKGNTYIFAPRDKNINGFFTELELITNIQPVDGVVSLVMTDNSVENKWLKDFYYKKFSCGLCLSSKNVEGNIIERTIVEPSQPNPQVASPETIIQGNTYNNTEQSKKVEGRRQDTTETTTTPAQGFSNDSSETKLKKPLIASAITLIGLTLMVLFVARSCSTDSSEDLLNMQKDSIASLKSQLSSKNSAIKSLTNELNGLKTKLPTGTWQDANGFQITINDSTIEIKAPQSHMKYSHGTLTKIGQ